MKVQCILVKKVKEHVKRWYFFKKCGWLATALAVFNIIFYLVINIMHGATKFCILADFANWPQNNLLFFIIKYYLLISN